MASFAQDPELLHDFLTEAGELLDDVEVRLVELERTPGDAELLNRIFRGFHTIKGGAGFLEAAALVEVCHKTETLFDLLRSGKLALDPAVMDDILAATGEVRRMFGEMHRGDAPTPSDPALIEALKAAAEGRPKPAPAAVAAPVSVPTVGAGDPDWAALYACLVGPATAASPPRPARAPAPASAPSAPIPADTSMRVDTARFDRILTLSGEIGLARNRLSFLRGALLHGTGDADTLSQLDLAVNRLGTLVSDLQGVVMKARMQPVGRVFQKYSRVARELARQLGKDVDLTLEGEDTEIDKTMLEELNDPLVHLIRNAVDHGIEVPAEREAAGKPAKGRIAIEATQSGDRILIRIRDDGRGMSGARLRAKAVEKGAIGAEEAAMLDERQSLALIFLPGFSTKDQVTNLSGRGVGMDVVRTNIAKLKGRIELESTPGQGSCVTIVLPLTLAILPVLVMRIAGQPFAMPLAAVREVIAIDDGKLQLVSGEPALLLRGQALPVVPLASLLGLPAGSPGTAGIVAQVGERDMVLRADAVVGQDEVMIKPLEGVKPRGIAGATVSGDGVLVLVLELNELMP